MKDSFLRHELILFKLRNDTWFLSSIISMTKYVCLYFIYTVIYREIIIWYFSFSVQDHFALTYGWKQDAASVRQVKQPN